MPDQKAVLIRDIKEDLELGTRPIPVPRDGQVLIKVTATMLLPHDAYSRNSGLLIAEKLPWVLGINIAGEIVSIGSNTTTSLKPGDHVFGLGDKLAPTPDQAGLQEYAILPLNALAKVPDGFTDDQVATLPVNVITSFIALFTKFGFNFPAPWSASAKDFDYKSQTIVIIAAGSNCGKFAAQFAKLAGMGTVIGIAALSNEAELKEYGATHVIDRHLPQAEIVDQIHAITGAGTA